MTEQHWSLKQHNGFVATGETTIEYCWLLLGSGVVDEPLLPFDKNHATVPV
jgi:hypothetical protein